jgi:hypothetical protein
MKKAKQTRAEYEAEDARRKAEAGIKPEDEMRPLYDFRGGIRGKYAKRYAGGTNIVKLDPDVAAAFPTEKLVNAALRQPHAPAEGEVVRVEKQVVRVLDRDTEKCRRPRQLAQLDKRALTRVAILPTAPCARRRRASCPRTEGSSGSPDRAGTHADLTDPVRGPGPEFA